MMFIEASPAKRQKEDGMQGYPYGPARGPAPTALVLTHLTALDEVAAQQGEVFAQQLA